MQTSLFGANKVALRGKKITDAIYGSIVIDKEHLCVLDSEAFQRLHYIKQGASYFVFPTSVHDRFSHSLGTMHIGRQMINAFLYNTERFIYECKDHELVSSYLRPAWDRLKDDGSLTRLANTFVLACLLHDVGHSPFSHTTEKFFQRNIERYSELTDYLSAAIDFSIGLSNDEPKPHERISAYLVCCESSNVNSVLKTINAFGGHRIETDLLNQDDTVQMARMILGIAPAAVDLGNNPSEETISQALINSLYKCAVSLLNSDSIDADKIDYLMRDFYYSGYTNIEVNHERIANSLTACFCIPKYLTDPISDLETTINSFCVAFSQADIHHAQSAMWARLSQKRYWHNNQTAKYFDYAISTAIDGILTVLQTVLGKPTLKTFSKEEGLGDLNDVFIRFLFDPVELFHKHPVVLKFSKCKLANLRGKGCTGIVLPSKPLTDDCIIQLFKFYASLWDALGDTSRRQAFFCDPRGTSTDNAIIFRRAALMKTLVDDIFCRKHLHAIMKTSLELDTLARSCGLKPDDAALKSISEFLANMSANVDHSLKRCLAGSGVLRGRNMLYEPLIIAMSSIAEGTKEWRKAIHDELVAVYGSAPYVDKTSKEIVDDCKCEEFWFPCYDDFISVKLALYLGKNAFTDDGWNAIAPLWNSITSKRFYCYMNIMESNPTRVSTTLKYQHTNTVEEYLVNNTVFLPDYDFTLAFMPDKLTNKQKATMFKFLHCRFTELIS